MSIGSSGGNLGSAVGFVVRDITRFARSVVEGTSHLQQLDGAVQQTGRNLGTISMVAPSVGGAVSLEIGLAVRRFADFDHQMTDVAASLGSANLAEAIAAALNTFILEAGLATDVIDTFTAAINAIVPCSCVSRNVTIPHVGRNDRGLCDRLYSPPTIAIAKPS